MSAFESPPCNVNFHCKCAHSPVQRIQGKVNSRMPRHLTRTLDERNDKIDSSDGGSRSGIVVLHGGGAHRVFGPIKQQVDDKISSHEINKDTQNNTDNFSHTF